MRPRGSIIGPLILITIGVLFLARTAWPAFSAWDFVSLYWPYLLILWGGLQIVEITVRAARGFPLPANGVSAGGWFLILVISIVGFGMFEVRGQQNWWRQISFEHGMDWFGDPHDYSIPEIVRTVGRKPEIVIEDFRGSVKVAGSAGNVLRIAGHKVIRAMKQADADRADRETPVEFSEQGNRVIIRLNQAKPSSRVRVSTDLELTVPEGASFRASGQSGDFDLSSLLGDVKISSDNAGVRLQDIGGSVNIDTRRGDVVRCTNVRGNVDLRGRSSDVELEKILGQVTINGAYSGTIRVREIAQPLHIENFHTNVVVQKVPGQIVMDRGSFAAREIVGPAQVSTHATDVEIAGFSDALDVSVDKGDITLRPAKNALARMTVRTGSGNIDLSLPDDAKFALRAATDRGEVENEYGAPLRVESYGKGARLSGDVGAGPSLTLTTDRGSVVVRKGDGAPMQAETTPAGNGEGVANGFAGKEPGHELPGRLLPGHQPAPPRVPEAPRPPAPGPKEL